ncbi:glycosyltransferase [Geomonas subterranea]|uniref:glycosyltransferase n=1 Tax=Geomonas subterranea TaxID=2847989 RepID=UPI001CD51F92|nr:glycosyltransferase [Geomonas fuzhouensis]
MKQEQAAPRAGDTRPRFSVIIPARNERKNIGRCLDSMLALRWRRDDYEVLVIDNGSSDDTVEIARSKGAQVLVQPGVTVAALRNLGARRSRGEILVFIDADCTVAPDWLEAASRYLERDDVVCFGSPPVVPPDATWVQRAWFRVRRKKREVGETQWLESMNMFLRREAFAGCGGFDERLVTCEDYDICIRLGRAGKIMNDERIVAVHHGEAATLAHFFRKERWRGASNLAGMRLHGVSRREVPSLLAPVLHGASLVLLAAACLAPAGMRGYLVLPVLLWHLLLLAKSLRVHLPHLALSSVLQLYLILNVYLLARGAALARAGR